MSPEIEPQKNIKSTLYESYLDEKLYSEIGHF